MADLNKSKLLTELTDIDYNIIKKSKIEKKVLFGVKFVIDND